MAMIILGTFRGRKTATSQMERKNIKSASARF